METSAKEWVNCPAIGQLWDTEKKVMDKYMSGLTEGDTVLDLACGTGWSSHHVTSQYGCSAVGSDILPDMVATAEATYGNERLTFVAGDMCEPRLVAGREGAFSWAMCHHGIQLTNGIQGFVATVRAALRDGGHLLINCVTRQFGDPLFTQSVHKVLRDARWQEHREKLEASLQVPMLMQTPPEGHWIKDFRSLLRLLESNGFTVLQQESCLKEFSVPVKNEFVRSVFGCVKLLPEELQQEFVDQVVGTAVEISGDAQPVANMNTVVILARKG